MSTYYDKTAAESVKALRTDGTRGLQTAEANRRGQTYGQNKLEEGKKTGIFKMIFAQLKDFLVIILIIAAVASVILGEALDGAIILAIVILNAVLGIYQENKANNALAALREMASPRAKVVRDGISREVASQELVPGDIVILETGDCIPADLRLLESVNLKIDEASLTGESVPSEKRAAAVLNKDAGLGDRINSAFLGTVITYGRGRGVITHTGMSTEMGKIASMLSENGEESTPLQKKLDSLGKLLGTVCLGVCALIFIFGLLRGIAPFEIFMTAIALAVAAIPEGLTVVVTVVLAMGMQRMVKVNAIIKRLSAVETLGSTTVICSDKTGTLTQNKMTVEKIYCNGEIYNVYGAGYSSEGSIKNALGQAAGGEIKRLVESAVLCNDAKYERQSEKMSGDPTEGALLVLAHKYGAEKQVWEQKYPRINEIPFDSARKLMSTFHRMENGTVIMYTKGAPDVLLDRCTSIEIDGAARIISEADRLKTLVVNREFAQSALRVIGFAYKVVNTVAALPSEEQGLTFAGLAGMIDPPREEVKPAVAICKRAGIQIKMITGDHKLTAQAIALKLGIDSSHGVKEGTEIAAMTDEELRNCVKKTSIFARVTPEHKVRLVEAVKANGEIAAMTGDGVNDAPSLKRADIGIAMGITGTDVSKEAADMILTDDNFTSIVNAVEEGRIIYANIRKVVGFLLSCNIGEILVIFIAMMANLPVPLAAIHLLAINLITDAFPAFALGMEKAEKGVMARPPRSPDEPIVNKSMAFSISIQSVAMAVGALASFIFTYGLNAPVSTLFSASFDTTAAHSAMTCCFLTLVLGELLRAYSARSETTSLFRMRIFENGYLNKCVIVSIAFMASAIYFPPLNHIFNTTPLSMHELLFALLFSILPVTGGEAAKLRFAARLGGVGRGVGVPPQTPPKKLFVKSFFGIFKNF